MSNVEDQEESLQELSNTPPCSEIVSVVKQEFVDDWLKNVENVEKETTISKSIVDDKKLTSLEGELDFEDEVVNGDEDKENAEDNNETGVSEPEEKFQNAEENTEEKEKKNESIEEGKDDGELSDDGDLEEGEVRDGSPSPKQPSRQICRFYSKGQCTWGNVCRFLHLSGNDKGNYNMFASSPPKQTSDSGPSSNHRATSHSDFLVSPPLSHILVEPTPLASAWEKGLRTAKELVKKANKRKEEEPDFDDKRLNLSLQVNERIVQDFTDSDSKSSKKKKKQNDTSRYEDEPDVPYEDSRETKENWRGGRYENFEIRWTREDNNRDRRDRERYRPNRMSSERDRFPKNTKNKDKWRGDNNTDSRPRADAWVDPWRRSKSPKGNRLSRSRSGSYSSLSSYSYSDRGSSRSSGSYSRSSSRSSRSSRSPAQTKKKASPRANSVQPPKKPDTGRFTTIKKKPGAKGSSSRSRSMSRTPSVSRSRSRSYSRSISMDSVSSASSSASGSSSGSTSKRRKNSNPKKGEERTNKKHQTPLGSVFPDTQTPAAVKIPKVIKKEPIDETDIDAVLLQQEKAREALKATPFPNLQHLLPSMEKSKEQNKGPHSKSIKLTLLNKAPPSKTASFQKKDPEFPKPLDDSSKLTVSVKRPLSPNPTANAASAPAPKKSASSRRDELLKQLKAVEDAIARKRSKV